MQQSATGRLTSGAAYALISRAMLYCNNWDAVKKAAKKIFAMGYKLTDQYADAFKGDGNTEAIYTIRWACLRMVGLERPRKTWLKNMS